ncbi:T9SS type B sorting domain-containing protein [Pedobacter frigiditerrae]|uniref:T9SS type B sorting domain-containing protein n=1 Tax=Pedobacter frigiditerrae TaxID=2530452 RepID=A0A4R0MKZ8_9SPHI|nr:gliding motility-associated C-terminal domain-containing protein [Pedobacter frigiditerrae]TCC87301.1 T9SS type B sorting domain-containing protein [Pedobacter frigiditerrae]
MRYLFLLFLCVFSHQLTLAAVPDNDDIKTARTLSSITGYCSADEIFTNTDATASGYKKASNWLTEGKDIWFKFTATHTDINVTVTGKATGNTNKLVNPLAAFYTYENNVLSEQIGSMTSNNNLTTAYKGGLTIGNTYYIRVSAENDATGTFKMCINNYNPPKKPGQDCSTAATLCSKETFTELNISGAGNNNHEAIGTCLSTESNTAWYTFTAANNGTLTFTITPTNTADDIDWVLFDLGINGDCSKVTAATAIRCASGSGVNCSPRYFITGLSVDATDLSEQSGCVAGQDGMLKFVDMEVGHIYALLIDNFSNGNNGFTLAFGGTVTFEGPKAAISVIKNQACTPNQDFTFNANASSYTNLKWSFGEGASLASSTALGPHTIKYSSTGTKTIVLETTGAKGCVNLSTYTLNIAEAPQKPIIRANKPSFCLKDTINLSVPEIAEASYLWTGPLNFTASTASVAIPLINLNQAGNYTLKITVGDCTSEEAIINIPTIVKNPIAKFMTDPQLPGKFAAPAPIKFINLSTDANTYLWDFGDNENSTEKEPTHTYQKGTFKVTLTAYTTNGCFNSISINDLVVLPAGSLLVPNSFSPNGDGVNDEFNINITNLKKFNINIFNRFGDKIFTSNNIFNSWNGTWHNQAVPVGAYFYQITGLDLFNKEVKHNGSITLIR